METNEQAKQEAIKKAWIDAGFYWKQIKDIIDEDGLLKLNHPSLKTQLTGYDKAYNNGLLKGCGFYGDSLMVILLPIEAIRYNNGWIRIEPDGSNLPDINDYSVTYRLGKFIEDKWYSEGNFHPYDFRSIHLRVKEKNAFTHYKPIEKEIPPVY